MELMSARNPSSVGARTEAAVASALVRAGKDVFVPIFSAHSRIDLIYIDEDGRHSVQGKTARRVGDALMFITCSNTGNVYRNYGVEIDVFGVYSADTELVYLVPAAAVPTRACSLRLLPTLNGQYANVRWADDYVLGPP